VLAAGGLADHVHLLLVLPATVTLASVVQRLKANSSRWIHEQGADLVWQEGYGAFSVSASNKGAVKHYIEHQAEHHTRRNFEDEFATMLKRSGVSFDPDHVLG